MSGKKPTAKIRRILGRFADGGSLNRWEAAAQLSDWCLPSTVAEIEHRFNVRVDRAPEFVRGYQDIPTRAMRYWLDEEQSKCARRILGQKKDRPSVSTPGLDDVD